MIFPAKPRRPQPFLARKAVSRAGIDVDVVGTIFTNGNGGPVTCQWAGDGESMIASTVTVASGQQQVHVGLKWNLRGTGTRHAAATFQSFTPGVISARSASFTGK